MKSTKKNEKKHESQRAVRSTKKQEGEDVRPGTSTEQNKTTPPKPAALEEEKKNTSKELDDIRQELAETKKELEKAKSDALYVGAELENVRKRTLREQEQKIQFANEKFIRDLLAIVDSFERALSAAGTLKAQKQKGEVGSFIEGVEVTHRELTQMLNRFKVEFVGEIGEPFDPTRHEAISQMEATNQEPNTIAQILQKGCLLNGRLLKPAKVIVAKVPNKSETKPGTDD